MPYHLFQALHLKGMNASQTQNVTRSSRELMVFYSFCTSLNQAGMAAAKHTASESCSLYGNAREP